MLELIKKFLIEYGFLKHNEPLDFSFEDQESFIFYIQNYQSNKIMLKVVFNNTGENEFKSQSYAYHTFPDFIPEPLFYRKFGNIEFLFFECIVFQNFCGQYIKSQKKIWHNDLPKFLFYDNSNIKKNNINDNDYITLINSYKNYLPQNIFSKIKIQLDTPLIDKYKSLPTTPQHGDFTVNNLGVRNSKMIIFDWENFGISYTYGLDFTTLISSTLNHNPNLIIQFLKGQGSKHTELLRLSFIKNSLISDHELELLFKVCYTLFYIMKRRLGYGEEIINKLHKSLSYILSY